MENDVITMIFLYFVLTCALIGVCSYRISEIVIGTQYDDEMVKEIIINRFIEIRNYTANEYDCKNYSKEYAIVMNLLGYETYVMYNYEEGHAYVLEAIEPQTGALKVMMIEREK
jgi:hypothetical protein